MKFVHLHPGVDVHQSSPGDRLHDAIVISHHLLQLSVTVPIGGAEHQRAHNVGDGSGHRGRRVETSAVTGQQLGTQTVHRGQNWREEIYTGNAFTVKQLQKHEGLVVECGEMFRVFYVLFVCKSEQDISEMEM